MTDREGGRLASWFSALRPARVLQPSPSAVPESVLAWTSARTGLAPVEWITETAVTIARHVETSTPDIQSADLRDRQFLAELLGLASLVALHEGRTVPRELIESPELTWPSGIYFAPFSDMLRITAQTNALMSDLFLTEWESFARGAMEPKQAREISRVIYACGLAIAEEALKYSIGQIRLTDETEILARYSSVVRLLETGTPPPDFEKTVNYRTEGGWHRSVLLHSGSKSPSELRSGVGAVVAQLAPQASLVINASPGRCWLWLRFEREEQAASAIGDLPCAFRHAAVGRPHFGTAGFIKSHAEATQVTSVMELDGVQLGRVNEYAEVGAWLPYLRDIDASAELIVDVLGALAATDVRLDPLRETIASLLRTQSPTATARELFLTRNAVGYRLRKAEGLLPSGWQSRPLATGVALAVRRLISAAKIDAAFARKQKVGS